MDTQIFFQTLKRHSKWFLLKKKSIVKKPKFYWERRLDRTSEGNGVAVRRKKKFQLSKSDEMLQIFERSGVGMGFFSFVHSHFGGMHGNSLINPLDISRGALRRQNKHSIIGPRFQ